MCILIGKAFKQIWTYTIVLDPISNCLLYAHYRNAYQQGTKYILQTKHFENREMSWAFL